MQHLFTQTHVMSHSRCQPRSDGRQSERARDNSIKVLEGERRRRRRRRRRWGLQEKPVELIHTSGKTRQHFIFFSAAGLIWTLYGPFGFKPFPREPAEEATGSRKCRKQEVPSGAEGSTLINPARLQTTLWHFMWPFLLSHWPADHHRAASLLIS